jgi:hypothetical protein
MKIYKTICPETAENEYRIELDIDVSVTLPDYSNDASDIDYYGCVELRDFEIISVQKRKGIENSNAPRQRKDVLGYTYDDVLIEDIPLEEREELMQEINKEVMKYVNC